MKNWVKILVLALILVPTIGAMGTTLTFDRITSNCPGNIEGQLFVDVSDAGTGVEFNFRNAGPVLSSIAEIYFYDGVLLNMWSINDSCQGVNFEPLGDPVNPKKLSGYNPDKDALVVLSATEPVGPEPSNGVNPNEWIKIGYTLQTGKTYQNLLDDLASGEVVIGIHVKAIGCSASNPLAETLSDSFISNPIPEPATMALIALGGLLIRRKK